MSNILIPKSRNNGAQNQYILNKRPDDSSYEQNLDKERCENKSPSRRYWPQQKFLQDPEIEDEEIRSSGSSQRIETAIKFSKENQEKLNEEEWKNPNYKPIDCSENLIERVPYTLFDEVNNPLNAPFQEILSQKNSEYDCIVDIGLISDISEKGKKGWEVEYSESFYNTLEEEYKVHQNMEETKESSLSFVNSVNNYQGSWNGAVVAIVGLYDKGKTFILNKLTETKLPSSKKVHTKGLSFKHAVMDGGTKLILLDTAGSYSPVKIENENSITLKEQAENFILDTVFELSDYFICVVNDFTSLDQRFLDKITRSLQNSMKNRFKEVIVVHNFKDVTDKSEIEELWRYQVTQIYPGNGCSSQTTRVAAPSKTGELKEKDVLWFKTEFTRHVCLANANCELGAEINPWSFSLLKYWLKTIFVPLNKSGSVIRSVVDNIQLKLRHYYNTQTCVKLEDTSERLKKVIKCSMSTQDNINLNQIESSAFIITRPDSFIPLTEIVEDGDYKIFMDVPGLTSDDITIKRKFSTTIIHGNKKRPVVQENYRTVKSERKYGEFEVSFKIPEEYKREWYSYEVKDGVLTIIYKKDECC